MGNIYVQLYEIWTIDLGDVVQTKSLRMDGHMTDGRRTKTDHNSPS